MRNKEEKNYRKIFFIASFSLAKKGPKKASLWGVWTGFLEGGGFGRKLDCLAKRDF